jgi:hypothetical protein
MPFAFPSESVFAFAGILIRRPPVTMLEKLDFQPLVEQTVTCRRTPRAMDVYRFVLGIVLRLYIGFQIAELERKVDRQAFEIDSLRRCLQYLEEQRKLQALTTGGSSTHTSKKKCAWRRPFRWNGCAGWLTSAELDTTAGGTLRQR